MPINGYKPPNHKYCQLRFTLRTNDSSKTPTINSVNMPKVIKTEDIYPKTSKNVYVKPVFSSGDTGIDQEVKLRTWWYIEE